MHVLPQFHVIVDHNKPQRA